MNKTLTELCQHKEHGKIREQFANNYVTNPFTCSYNASSELSIWIFVDVTSIESL